MPDPTWISVPDTARLLGLRDRDVRQMFRDRELLAVASPTGATGTAREFLDLGAGAPRPIDGLRGTLTLLADGGMPTGSAADWLFAHDDELGTSPVEALRAGQVHAVRRVALAQAL